MERKRKSHYARHSFAANILNNGMNIKTVVSLLGHSGLKYKEKYTRAVDKLKEEAIRGCWSARELERQTTSLLGIGLMIISNLKPHSV